MPRPRRVGARRRSGFTVMEALVVVAIIGISAAIAAPALSVAMADRRASEATHSLVRLGARARSEAMAYGRAHLLAYSNASSGNPANNGSATLWRGTTNLCNANQWATVMANPSAQLERLDMGAFNHGTHQVRMQAGSATQLFLCFQPNGDVLSSTAGAANFAPPPVAGPDGVRFTFDRLVDGAVEGVPRVVVFPYGGTPRIDR